MRKIVLTFDICSSTAIIENLVQNDRIEDCAKLVDGLWSFLHTRKDDHHFAIYKFLGDGFILIFDDRQYIDDIIRFCDDLVFFSEQILTWFKHEYLDLVRLPREGITIGMAEGVVRKVGTINIALEEYIGRPINVACRLQKAMDEPRHVNKALIHSDLYKRITNRLRKKACRETSRSLHNISGDAEIRCYEYDPKVFLESRWERLRGASSANQVLAQDPKVTKDLRAQIEEVQRTSKRILAAMKASRNITDEP